MDNLPIFDDCVNDPVSIQEQLLLIQTGLTIVKFGTFKPYIQDLEQFFEVINEQSELHEV